MRAGKRGSFGAIPTWVCGFVFLSIRSQSAKPGDMFFFFCVLFFFFRWSLGFRFGLAVLLVEILWMDEIHFAPPKKPCK